MAATSSAVVYVSKNEWAQRINGAWQKSVESIIETGRLIAEAKAVLHHGEYLDMVRADLPFNRVTAHKLMAIAANPTLSNVSIWKHMPSSWTTLYELTRWEEQELKHAFGNRLISGDTKCSDLKDLRNHVRRFLRGLGIRSKKPNKAEAEKIIKFFATGQRLFSPAQIAALNNLDERLKNDLWMEFANKLYSLLEE